MGDSYIKWFSELNKKSGGTAGGKGANLAEMTNAKFPIPPGFVLTTKAYNSYIDKTGIKKEVYEILESIDVNNTNELNEKAKKIRDLMINVVMPEDIKEEIEEAYEHLSVDKNALQNAKGNALSILKTAKESVFVAVRSSATTEDLDDSSFAGQQETYLNVKGNHDLIKAIQKVLASLFTSRAIYYRKKRGFSKEKFALAVVVQKMINADKSGVMFSKNPIKSDDTILIEAVYGLGEGIVSGKINPDTYIVSDDLKIISKKIGSKKTAITRSASGETKQIKLNEDRSKSQVLTEGEIISLANIGERIEEHYGKPQDIEFALEDGEIFITQSRPITTSSEESDQKIEGEAILTGLGASPGIAQGKVKIIKTMADLPKVQKGDILVTEMTNPDMVITMAKANAIVTDEGGITSHAAIVSREMGIPAVVGTSEATKILKEDQEITVDGRSGKIYLGKVGEEEKAEVLPVVPTKIKIKVIVDLPQATERAALTKCEAIGLTRLEGIIASSKRHPNYYIKNGNWEEYISTIEQGIEKISKPFKEMWIRTSDVRTDEYPNLEGAPPDDEANPMMGDHAIRFHLKHKELFKAELTAIKNVSQKYPEKKFGFMIPLVISPEEVIEAKKIANDMELIGKVKFGIMIETPAACLIIKDLLKVGVDFISFGTNDLTQFTLAIDRNNGNVQNLFNEQHPAVLNEIKRVLRTCQEMGVESSICGQAGSKKEMAKFLVENGINSISVNADAAYDISKLVSELENSNLENNESVGKKQTPEQKTKQVINKIEGEIVKEIVNNPKPIFNPNQTNQPSESNTPTEKKPPTYVNPEKKAPPAYISGMTNEDISALGALFGNDNINNNIPKMEESNIKDEPLEKVPKADEEEEVLEQPEDDEVSNLF